MKKALSVILCLIMTIQLVPSVVFAQNSSGYISALSFDDLPTNYIPTDEITLSGDGLGYICANEAGDNKFLKTVLKSTSKTVSFSTSAISGSATYSFEINSDPGIATTVSLLSGAGKANNVFNVSEKGKISVVSGPELKTRITNGDFRKITFLADTKTKRLSIYADNRLLLGNWYFTSMPDTLGGVRISSTEADGIKSYVYLDNFVCCEGFNLKIKASKVKFNPQVLESIIEPGDELPEEEVIGSEVFVNSNFDTEESLSGFQLGASKGGKNERIYDERRGNGYLVIEPGTETSRVDVLFDGTRYVVIEADLSLGKAGFSGQLFMFKNGAFSYILKLTATGQVQTYSGSRTVCTLQKNKWTTVSAVCDFDEMIFDVYADKKLVYSDIPMQASEKGYITRLRALSLSAGSGALYMDNIRAYEGIAIRDLSAESTQKEEKSIFADDADITSLLGENTVLSYRSGAVYNGQQKLDFSNVPYLKNEEIYAPIDAASALLGAQINYDASAGLTINGKKMGTVVKTENKDNTVFLPIIYTAKNILSKQVLTNDRGFCIVSSEPVSYTNSELIKINNYILYKRPQPDEILETFQKRMSGVHPRVIITKEDIERIKYNYQTKDYYKAWVDKIISSADRYLTSPAYGFDYAANNFETGARRGIRDRIIYFGIAYFMTGDLKYPQRAYNELVSAANFPHWRHEKEYLDTAEMMISFAIGYDWFYDCWTETQRKFLADTVMEKGMKHSRANYYGVAMGTSTWWSTTNTNWNACCNNGTFEAALALMDEYPELCSDLISKSIRATEPMLKEFYPSGAWFEGTGYHGYILEHMSMMVNGLQKNFGTDYNLMLTPALNISGDYIVALDGPVASNNFHDSSEGHSLPATLTWLGNSYNKPSYIGERLNGLRFYGLSSHFFDVLYWPKDFDENVRADIPKDMSFASTELVVLRSEYSNPEATYLSYHAGDVVAQHSHVDAGSFVLDMNGVRWAIDLGADDYNADGYFDQYGKRNNYYRVRAEGHNVSVIDPDESAGQDLYAFMPIESLTSASGNGFSTVDLTPAYKKSCESYRRGFMLGDNRRTITVRDEYKFLDGDHELYWFMHTRAEVEIVDDTTAILTQKGKRLKAQLITDIEGAKFSVMKAEPLPTSPNPNQLANGKAVKLAVHGVNLEGSKYIQVRFSDADDEISNKSPQDITIVNWTSDNTPYTPRPAVADIKADGETVSGFDSKVTNYLVPVSYKTRHMPEITATADNDCVIKITKATNVDENTVVRVYRKDNPADARNYIISYQLQITSEDKEYVPVSVTASRAPELANPAKNGADGNLSTRWSADGEGEWLQLEFAESVPVKLVRVAAMNATSRRTKFDIEVSEDGVTWTKIIEHETDGMTPGYEYMECDAKGKYVRLYGHGNSVNEWNSILEFSVIDTRDW